MKRMNNVRQAWGTPKGLQRNFRDEACERLSKWINEAINRTLSIATTPEKRMELLAKADEWCKEWVDTIKNHWQSLSDVEHQKTECSKAHKRIQFLLEKAKKDEAEKLTQRASDLKNKVDNRKTTGRVSPKSEVGLQREQDLANRLSEMFGSEFNPNEDVYVEYHRLLSLHPEKIGSFGDVEARFKEREIYKSRNRQLYLKKYFDEMTPEKRDEYNRRLRERRKEIKADPTRREQLDKYNRESVADYRKRKREALMKANGGVLPKGWYKMPMPKDPDSESTES